MYVLKKIENYRNAVLSSAVKERNFKVTFKNSNGWMKIMGVIWSAPKERSTGYEINIAHQSSLALEFGIMDNVQKLKIVKNAIGTYPNFPQNGITFRDIFGIFQDVTALRALKDLIIGHASSLEIDIVVGLDSRGFLLGPIISIELGIPFLPIRKKGKLPGKVIQQSYTLEYGEDIFEIQTGSLSSGKKALIVDDLLATGGSMAGAVQLLRKTGVTVVECLAIIELTSLNGRSKLNVPVHSLIQYE